MLQEIPGASNQRGLRELFRDEARERLVAEEARRHALCRFRRRRCPGCDQLVTRNERLAGVRSRSLHDAFQDAARLGNESAVYEEHVHTLRDAIHRSQRLLAHDTGHFWPAVKYNLVRPERRGGDL